MGKLELLYRTRFLIAHNALHEIVYHSSKMKKTFIRQRWEKYLKELGKSEKSAKKPA